MSNVNSLGNGAATQRIQRDGSGQTLGMFGKFILTPVKFIHEHLFTISVITILLIGWSRRDDNYLSAENGTGYALGIIGGSLMLFLLLYPLSKKSPLLVRLIPMRYWFGIHMAFGIIGPVMVLFHANFHIGSLNSTVALVSMLLVAGSGLIGRYIYTRIHHGLYGRQITFEELKQEADSKYSELALIYEMDEKLNRRRSLMEERALQKYRGISISLLHALSLAIESRLLKHRARRVLKAANARNQINIDRNKSKVIVKFLDRYTTALRNIVAFRIYERLFSLWHILHLPLFFMMIITAVIHIFAVHLY